MASCIIHVDGSSYKDPHNKKDHNIGLGWGIVAEHGNETYEATGGYATLRNHSMSNAHEDIALLHALQYMRDNGFSPQNTTIYCDDELLGHSPTYLAKENGRGYMAEKIEHRVIRAAKFIGQELLVPKIMDELHDVRMHKIKGHQGHVYQERVDYLAKWHAHVVVGNITEKLSFEKWLAKGLVIYMPPEEKVQPRLVDSPDDSLIALGLLDPPRNKEDVNGKLASALPYKPRVRIQYAHFVRTLLTCDENIMLENAALNATDSVSP